MQNPELLNTTWKRLMLLNKKERIFPAHHYTKQNWAEVKAAAEKRYKNVTRSLLISTWVYWVCILVDIAVIVAVKYYSADIEMYKVAILLFLTLTNATTRENDRVRKHILEEQLFLIDLMNQLQEEY
ncbi:MAG: hypothetical protein JWN76_803 [Chitinophagaceae bacterium]|nr:hypothetical protein [Chitinophagaceae bacterium]